MSYEYRLFGLPLRSALPLPELDAVSHADPDAVEIGFGAVADVADTGTQRHILTATDDGAILSVRDVGRFAILGGREILVDPHPDASDRNVRIFLLGSAMGALLHQRSLLPLHANAIDIDGGAVAFLGYSGAGKSTLAAAFHDRGRPILSDDVCVVSPHDDAAGGGFVAQPGIPRLRLWRDAIERSGRSTDGHDRAFDAVDKYTVPTDAEARSGPLPLKALFLLAPPEEDAPLEIRQLEGIAAVEVLVTNTYRGRFLRKIGEPHAHFSACLALARAVPIFRLSRPWDPTRIDETIALIEGHLRTADIIG